MQIVVKLFQHQVYTADVILVFLYSTGITKFRRYGPRRRRLTKGVATFAFFDRNRRLTRKRYEIRQWSLSIRIIFDDLQ